MSEPGIIGQMYEDRKSKKVGKLLSRDEKYKTLMFEGEDGKTFSISNSTFRSNWRKLQNAEEQLGESSDESTNDKPEVTVHVDDGLPTNVDNDIAKHQAKKSVQKLYTLADFDEFVQEVTVPVDDLRHNLVISKNNRTGKVGIKYKWHILFELWFHYNATNFNLHMKPFLYELIPWKEENQDVPTLIKDGWINNTVRVYDKERLNSVLEDVLRGCAIWVEKQSETTKTTKNEESEE